MLNQKKESAEKLFDELNETSVRLFSIGLAENTEKQAYQTVCACLCERLAKMRKQYRDAHAGEEKKEVCYLSMEFLVGTSLRNHLFNLGLEESFREVLASGGHDLEKLYALDPDAGLGNGGLGRLAACYLDSLTGLGQPVTGYSIRYEFGIFKQKIIDGWQVEFPDNWLDRGEVWLHVRHDESYEVRFGGEVREWVDAGCFRVSQSGYQSVVAVPYDMYISGYGSDAVNKLTLWSAQLPGFDMPAFSRGEYVRSLEENTMAEVISKVLYPADHHVEGKRLRLKQQYLLVSASLQSILARHFRKYGRFENLPEKVAVHINDTHPSLSVPELMRLLMDEKGFGWDKAWEITCRTLSYTNHTVMREALECWSEWLFREQLPRIYAIVLEIDRRQTEMLRRVFAGDLTKIGQMTVIGADGVRMVNLCLACCHRINGVSALHTEILKKGIFKDYYELAPERFLNVTNGIAFRRWLCQANPLLTSFLRETIGDGFLSDAMRLTDLLQYRSDPNVLSSLSAIKRKNKESLAAYIASANGIRIDPDSLFDVQIKRLHEYKRQLLNILHVLSLYLRLKHDPAFDPIPRTFLFGAKASPGYTLAKEIIRLIVTVSDLVNSDRKTREKLRVVFLEDYKVSLAEKIIPAAEISEQISLAGKEASGTGNMKLMLNGAVTVGTLDGANVEIAEQVGKENIFLFGMTAEEADSLKKQGYSPQEAVDRDPLLREVIDLIRSAALGNKTDGILSSLFTTRFGAPDPYMTLADFSDYVRVQNEVDRTARQKEVFSSMSLVNIAKAGVFSADRAVKEYCEKIWGIR